MPDATLYPPTCGIYKKYNKHRRDEVLVLTIQIREITIVLSPHDIVTMKLTIASDFTNAFLLRFKTDNQPVNPFANEGHSSVHFLLKSIMIFLRDIRSSIHKFLNKVSSATSDFNRDTKHIPLYTWLEQSKT